MPTPQPYQPSGPFPYRLPPALCSHLVHTIPDSPSGGQSLDSSRHATPMASTRPKIKVNLSSHATTGDFSSYSALSPVHDLNRNTPRTIYSQLLPAAANSTDTLPSPARLRSPVFISTSSSHLPLSIPLDTPPQPASKNPDDAGVNVGRKASTMSGLLDGLSGKWGTWKKAERARMQTIHKQRMSNGTANFYFPPEEQEWDPKAIKRLSRIGQKAQ